MFFLSKYELLRFRFLLTGKDRFSAETVVCLVLSFLFVFLFNFNFNFFGVCVVYKQYKLVRVIAKYPCRIVGDWVKFMNTLLHLRLGKLLKGN